MHSGNNIQQSMRSATLISPRPPKFSWMNVIFHPIAELKIPIPANRKERGAWCPPLITNSLSRHRTPVTPITGQNVWGATGDLRPILLATRPLYHPAMGRVGLPLTPPHLPGLY